jgi:acetyl-CoA carboxylase biotin carboxyl carrier protein
LPADAIIVRAPNLGTFYRAPKPGADDYVRIGSDVAKGQEICLIEVMKLFTAVRSEQAGRVHAVLAEDGAMVEAGQPLFALVLK